MVHLIPADYPCTLALLQQVPDPEPLIECEKSELLTNQGSDPSF
jgi:hypothetical protein